MMRAMRAGAVLAICLAAGAARAGDKNPMADVDETLLLGKPAVTEPRVREAEPVRESEALVHPEPDAPVVEATDAALDPYATDAPIAPMDDDGGEDSVGSSLATYKFLPGDTLRGALERWARDAGYVVVWRAEVDMAVDIEMTYARGTDFEQAVEQTLGAFWRRGAELTGSLYRNRVLVVSERTKS